MRDPATLSPRGVVYLFAATCLTASFALGWLLCPRLRRSSMLAAIVLAPFAVMGFVFVPAYWQPDHWFTFVRGVGVEDVLFCFACGGVSWVVAATGCGVRVDVLPEPGALLARLLAWAAIAFAGVVAAWWAGCGILEAVIAGFVLSGLVVLGREPRGARLILPGAIGFTLVYAAVSWVVLAVYPEAGGFWVAEAISGRRVLGLPVEELVWAVSFGATWPVVFTYCVWDGVAWPPHSSPANSVVSEPLAESR
jgi:hypothetical protein